ncbi:MAG: NmrA family NAD(P)-binding protein, partial [bacterium]
IPHHKLEQLILTKGMDYVFLRPSYFMQNLTTTLIHEIKTENKIFIPSGNLRFTWVDTRDIGFVAAHILNEFEKFQNQAIEITGREQKDFHKVAEILSRKIGRSIRYESPNLLKFYIKKRRQGVKPAMIFVMIMLHYLPRFSRKKSRITGSVKDITGKEPGTLEEFIEREKASFQ